MRVGKVAIKKMKVSDLCTGTMATIKVGQELKRVKKTDMKVHNDIVFVDNDGIVFFANENKEVYQSAVHHTEIELSKIVSGELFLYDEKIHIKSSKNLFFGNNYTIQLDDCEFVVKSNGECFAMELETGDFKIIELSENVVKIFHDELEVQL